MVERITNDKEPRDERRPDVMFHPPTFEKEYIHFLSNPEAVNMAWLAVLFGVLCCSSRFQTGGADDSSLFDNCLFHTAQCLAMANYTTPGRYKVEAMIMYLGLEYLKASDAQVGVSVLTSILTRLAVHMGYHRDSKHYPRISIFDGEMRRRVYLYLVMLDSALSSQAGVPQTVPKSQSDTELPRNLLDEDLHPDMTVLPPSRPETDLTPVAFMLIKKRLLNIATEIADIASSVDGRSYDQVLYLDQRLQEFYHNIPPLLRMRSSVTSIIDPPDVILHRYEHALSFQRERCMLHRRYLSQSRHDAQYAYSRWACLDAAQMILRYQVDLHGESALGEQVRSSGAIFFSSLTTGKYLTAAMIICLELSFRAVEDHAAVQAEDQHILRENLVQSLQTSHGIWMASRGRSEEARKAAETTGFMLGLTRFRAEVQTEDVIPASGMVGQADAYPMGNPVELIPSLELLQGMLNDPSRFDWCLWDTTF
ncbi:hypothetical protein MW887_001188 [Aspergillus wentii]|nr:hypothetical protein MW887_001188 [Aspergillus wentii]